MRYHQINGEMIPFTDKENTEYDAAAADYLAKADDRTAARHRKARNRFLTNTDWMSGTDVTMADNWKTYRQALRDLPTHSNWPNLKDNDWPTKPGT